MYEKRILNRFSWVHQVSLLVVLAITSLLLVVRADTFAEMDTTVSNDFWNCTGRVNPSISSGSGSLATLDAVTFGESETARTAPFESRYLTEVLTDAMRLDTRRPFALFIRIR